MKYTTLRCIVIYYIVLSVIILYISILLYIMFFTVYHMLMHLLLYIILCCVMLNIRDVPILSEIIGAPINRVKMTNRRLIGNPINRLFLVCISDYFRLFAILNITNIGIQKGPNLKGKMAILDLTPKKFSSRKVACTGVLHRRAADFARRHCLG